MPTQDAPPSSLPPVSATLWRWFTWYARRYVRRHFQAVRLAWPGLPKLDPAAPLLIYLNHPSWWDPLTCLVIASGPMKARHHRAPIDAAALGKYNFFEKLGFFGVERDTAAGARTFLRIGGAILRQPGGTLWVPAQGHFTDPRARPITLRPGTAHLARQLARPNSDSNEISNAIVLPLAIEYPFWEERLPQALLHFGQPIQAREQTALSVSQWQTLLEQRLEITCDELQKLAIARDVSQFEILIRGSVGVNRVYDWGRSIRARIRGQRFHKGHSDAPDS